MAARKVAELALKVFLLTYLCLGLTLVVKANFLNLYFKLFCLNLTSFQEEGLC